MEHGEKAVLEAVSQKIRGFEVVKDEHRKNKGVEIQKPKRGTSRSAGYDFFSPIDVTIGVGEQKMIWLDVKAYMQSNEVLLIDVRSSQGKPRIRLANTIGVIDSDYYGNVKNDGNIGIMLENHGSQPYVIKTGDRIAQGIFTVYLVADEDECINETRKGGYGSTN
ncbi:hypothetical protein [Bacillus gaemokensis]|uniref:hypothetical protein n=1 Tax=Bacillus gaemokensis TaxID=574375 RepID=UPI00069088B3|nr:hypothetical protein [Bacillus gaemokensis]KYG38153.1 deoxyuridine 5'-triphosphate nucleotidohydrolase [Bacillus gaemokensis]